MATAALYGIGDPPDVASHLLESGIVLGHPRGQRYHPAIMLFRPGIDLADLPWLLFESTPLLANLIIAPGADLGQVADDGRHDPNLTPEAVNPVIHLGESGRASVHISARALQGSTRHSNRPSLSP